jgi:hypothetical protein
LNIENLSTLKIHRLTQAQYDRELAAGTIDPTALYLTPDEDIDTSEYVKREDVENMINAALASYSSGKTLAEHLTTEDLVLVLNKHYGATLPDDPGPAGRIFFKLVDGGE